jgi:hypothetical protein
LQKKSSAVGSPSRQKNSTCFSSKKAAADATAELKLTFPVDQEELIAQMDNSELKELLIAKFTDRLEPDMSARRDGLNTAERHLDMVDAERKR